MNYDIADNVPVDYSDLQTLIVCSVRYAAGRRSYIVRLIKDIIFTYSDYMSTSTLHNIEQEIKEVLEKQAGDQCDLDDWKLAVDHINTVLLRKEANL